MSFSSDQITADAFASSWNTLPPGSIYNDQQFVDWLTPVSMNDVRGKRVLELGCGNASMMLHMKNWEPAYLEGIDLGDSVRAAIANLKLSNFDSWCVKQADLIGYRSEVFDLVYCCGVLHHLQCPLEGLRSVIENVAPGGRFHCWVYGYEGNTFVRYFVDPLRRIASRLPWWFTKYFLALPLAVPFFFYAKFLASRFLAARPLTTFLGLLPLVNYCRWAAQREFRFFWHVAFDQLVAPKTSYIRKAEIQEWMQSFPQIDPKTVYIIPRNDNSWKFGAILKTS